MPTPGGLVTKQELIDAQDDTRHLGEVANGLDISGNPITTSTSREGEEHFTVRGLQAEYLSAIGELGYVPVAGDFDAGGTVSERNQVLLWTVASGGDGYYYKWLGVLPKVVTAGSTPSTAGGTGAGAWSVVGGIDTGFFASRTVTIAAGLDTLDLRYDDFNPATGTLLSVDQWINTRQFFEATIDGATTGFTITDDYEITLNSTSSGGEVVSVIQNDPDSPTKYSTDNGVVRPVISKLSDYRTVTDYIVAGDVEAAITTMASDLGYVRFPAGNTAISNSVTISAPAHFAEGAYLTIASGQTVTFESTVESPRQFIFQGDGTVSFTGEDSRSAHVSWFGAFPDVSGSDAAPFMQACTDAMGNTREANIHFDVGTYYIDTGVTWNRATKLHGAGDRLTNIWVSFLTGDVFDTNGPGCNFHDFQFNVTGGPRTSGAFIALNHERCEAYDIYMDSGYIGIDIDPSAFECETHRVKGLSWSTAAGSRVVRVRGDDATVETVNYTNSTPVGPEYVVGLDADASNVERPKVTDVSLRSSQGGVGVLSSSTFTVNEFTIDGVRGREGTNAVKVLNSGTAGANVGHITDVIAGTGMTSAVSLEVTNTGDIFGILLDEVTANQVSGNGIEVLRNGAGSLAWVSIGQHNLRGDNGILVGGVNIPINIAIGAGFTRNCTTNGYDITAQYITAHAISARDNTGTGILVRSGSTFIDLDGLSSGNGTDLTDNSGAVTKDINILV